MEQKNQYVFINFPNNFQLYIKPSKKGYDSSQLSKECEWSISNVIGPKIHDLDSEDLPIFNFRIDNFIVKHKKI